MGWLNDEESMTKDERQTMIPVRWSLVVCPWSLVVRPCSNTNKKRPPPNLALNRANSCQSGRLFDRIPKDRYNRFSHPDWLLQFGGSAARRVFRPKRRRIFYWRSYPFLWFQQRIDKAVGIASGVYDNLLCFLCQTRFLERVHPRFLATFSRG